MNAETTASLATAAGTLVLAIATFASVRSANRAARTAERSLLEGLRPVMVASRLQDPPEKIAFIDDHWVRVEGGHAAVEVTDEAIYLAIGLRNVGSGIGVLDGWHFTPERLSGETAQPDPSSFRRLTRDIYVPAGDVIIFSHTLLGGATLDAEELVTTIRDVAIVADEYDDRIAARYGGSTMQDLLEDSVIEHFRTDHDEKNHFKS